jgi:GST-like protein
MLTLYGTKGSGSAAIEAALALAGAAYRKVDAATWKPGPGYDELKRVNPLGQIPALVLEDGAILTESAAILIHLAHAFPESGLLPAGAGARAQAIRGLVFIAANCYAAIGVLDYPERWSTGADEAQRQRIIAGSRSRLHSLWDMFADTFPAAPWLGGERIGALDLYAAVVSKWDGARKHLAGSRPEFSALLARIEAEPRVAGVFARHWPAP